jgi:hypothetical protein
MTDTQPPHLRSLLDAITRSQSRTLCFFRYFFVRYLRYLQAAYQAASGTLLATLISRQQCKQCRPTVGYYRQKNQRVARHAHVAPLGELCLCDHRDLGLVLGDLDIVTQDTCKAAQHSWCYLHTQYTQLPRLYMLTQSMLLAFGSSWLLTADQHGL